MRIALQSSAYVITVTSGCWFIVLLFCLFFNLAADRLRKCLFRQILVIYTERRRESIREGDAGEVETRPILWLYQSWIIGPLSHARSGLKREGKTPRQTRLRAIGER